MGNVYILSRSYDLFWFTNFLLPKMLPSKITLNQKNGKIYLFKITIFLQESYPYTASPLLTTQPID